MGSAFYFMFPHLQRERVAGLVAVKVAQVDVVLVCGLVVDGQVHHAGKLCGQRGLTGACAK